MHHKLTICVVFTCLTLAWSTWAGPAPIAAEIIALEGTQAPGAPAGMLISNLNTSFTNGNGLVGFTGSLTTGNFVWYDDGVVFTTADGLPTVLTGAEQTMGIGDAGEFIYAPQADGLDAVWTNNGLLLAEEDPAPDVAGQFITFCSRPMMIPDGTAYWVSGLSSTQGGSSQGRALYRSAMAGLGATEVVLRTGDVVDGLTIASPSGVDFNFHISDNGQHHIQELFVVAPLASDDALVVDGVLVAREGLPTGGGDNWATFDITSINDAGDYLFTGNTDGATSMDEYIAFNAAIVVREGQTLDGVTLTGATLRAASLNNNGDAAHMWGITGGTEILFFGAAATLADSSIVVLRTDDLIDVDGDAVADYIVSDFPASPVIGPGLSLAEDGFVVVQADVQAVVNGVPTGAELESIVRLAVDTPVDCPADIDSTGTVDGIDLGILLANWSIPVGAPGCGGALPCASDLNGDGVVDGIDLGIMLANWGACR